MRSGGLVDRHIAFVEALRAAGVPVSLAEDVDAATAIGTLGLAEREALRATYAATLVKRVAHRPSFDALFDLYFPALVGEGRTAADEVTVGPQDTGPALAAFREEMAEAMRAGDQERLQELAIQAVARFGAMPGRAPGLSSWSAYQALKRLDPDGLVQQVAEALRAGGVPGRRTRRRQVLGPVHRARRGRRTPPDRGGEGSRARRRHHAATDDRQDRLHQRPSRGPRADAPGDLPARPATGHPAQPGAPLATPPRTAGLPAYGPRLDLHRRRPAHHPSSTEASAPHRARGAVRRERLGRELRPVHPAAGLRAARPVHQGPGVHVRRPGPRGHLSTSAPARTSPT